MALDFFAGCAGGAAGVIVGHPLDTVKVRIQTQSPDNIKYRGTFHALSQIVKQESVFGLYKGITSPLVGVAGINAIVFGVYGMLRPYVAGHPGHDSLWAHFLAGAASGSVQSVVCAPMELVKIRMQTNESHAPRQNSVDILKAIYRNEGGLFRGVYKGWMITLMREIPGFGSYFATYELLTAKSGYQVGTLGMLLAGGMAGVVSWILCFPMDVVKTRIQMHGGAKRLGIMECTKQILKAEGYKAFFRGMNSSVIRAFPTNAATFTIVNWIIRLTSPKEDDLHNGREELAHLTKGWDLSRFQSKEIVDIMNQWTGLSNYSYLSSKCLFPHSSIVQSSTPRFSFAQNLKSFSRPVANTNASRIHVDKLPVESIRYTATNYEMYELETSQDASSRATQQTETSHSKIGSYEEAHCSSSNNRSNNCPTKKETLVVSHANASDECSCLPADHKETASSLTLFGRLTDWLSNFTLTPVHFCKCVENCSCRD